MLFRSRERGMGGCRERGMHVVWVAPGEECIPSKTAADCPGSKLRAALYCTLLDATVLCPHFVCSSLAPFHSLLPLFSHLAGTWRVRGQVLRLHLAWLPAVALLLSPLWRNILLPTPSGCVRVHAWACVSVGVWDGGSWNSAPLQDESHTC